MTRKAKVLRTETLYERYNSAYEYELQMPSQKPGVEYGEPVKREMLHTNDSVFVLIHAVDIDSFVLVREFRTGIFFNKGDDDPFLISCVAGAMDKDKTPEETARLEVKEEAGLDAGELHHIATAYASPGRMTEKTHLFYTQVKGIPQTGSYGLESEGEDISTRIISREEVYNMLDRKGVIDAMTLACLYWFKSTYG